MAEFLVVERSNAMNSLVPVTIHDPNVIALHGKTALLSLREGLR
jgi:hypothetical protein